MPEELERVDALAAEHGITRQEAIGLCLVAWRPANDAADRGTPSVPPTSPPTPYSGAALRRWRELVAAEQAAGRTAARY